MRVVFLYVARGQAPVGANTEWDREKPATNSFALTFEEEGFYWLFRRMLEEKIVDEVFVIIEATAGSGCMDFGGGMYGFVTPEIDQIREYMRPEDIVWCRGGWKTWTPFLNWAVETKKWTLCYAANMGGAKLTFWDVVFNDLDEHQFVDRRGRFQFYFKKPTNPIVFHPEERPYKYDLCIGASRIYDKKGQWRGVKVVASYEKMYGIQLKCVMPGGLYHSTHTNVMKEEAADCGLDIDYPGWVSKRDLRNIYNSSRVFGHFGYGGQNDRGTLEALRCGTPLMVATPNTYPPYMTRDRKVSLALNQNDSIENMTRQVKGFMDTVTKEGRQYVFDYHEKHNGMERVILPEMGRMFDFFRGCSRADKKALWAEYGEI